MQRHFSLFSIKYCWGLADTLNPPPRVTLTWKKPQYPEGYGSFFQSNVLLVSISSILNSFVFL